MMQLVNQSFLAHPADPTEFCVNIINSLFQINLKVVMISIPRLLNGQFHPLLSLLLSTDTFPDRIQFENALF